MDTDRTIPNNGKTRGNKKAAAKTKYVRRTPRTLKDGIENAERKRDVQQRPTNGIVAIEPWRIETRPEMFQVREFTYGHKDTDLDHVKKLERTIGIVRELDPPVVIKIDGVWVCIDGHHRIAAYNRVERRDPIKCFWFGGTVREAVDEAIRLNSKDRLNVSQQDRTEAAWKLVLLGKHSKSEIVKLCQVADGTVGKMRRLMKLYEDKNDVGAKLFRKRLGEELEDTKWMVARLAYAGVEPKAIDDEERAAKLAKALNRRMTNLLSRDPRITARALEIYNPGLPRELMKVWEERLEGLGLEEDTEADGNLLPEL